MVIDMGMTKEELEDIRHLDRQINCRLYELDQLKKKQTVIKSIDYSKDKIQSSNMYSLEDGIIKIVDREHEVTMMIDELIDRKRKAEEEISKLDGLHRTILLMRYIACMPWNLIKKELHFADNSIYKPFRKAIERIESL